MLRGLVQSKRVGKIRVETVEHFSHRGHLCLHSPKEQMSEGVHGKCKMLIDFGLCSVVLVSFFYAAIESRKNRHHPWIMRVAKRVNHRRSRMTQTLTDRKQGGSWIFLIKKKKSWELRNPGLCHQKITIVFKLGVLKTWEVHHAISPLSLHSILLIPLICK